jgi:hypothetical protein
MSFNTGFKKGLHISEKEYHHFDEYWQLLSWLGHQTGANPRRLNSCGINSKLPRWEGRFDCQAEEQRGSLSIASDFLTIHPSERFRTGFLQSLKSSQASWSMTPRGALNVQKLLANKPCFANPSPLEHEKKQSILFHDWSALGWDINRSTQVIRLADDLLQEGYPLYAFHAGELVKVKSGAALVDLLKQNNAPYSDDELVFAAGKKKISRDMLHIINYHQLNTFIDGSEAQDKTIETGYWWHNLKPSQRDALLFSLKNAKPPFDSINCTIFPDDIRMTRELGALLNISNITWHVREVNLSPRDLDILVGEEKLIRRDIVLDEKDFAGIKSLTVHHCNETLTLANGLPALLKKFTAIKHLGLEKAQNTACLRSINFELPCETLNLDGSDIDNQTLENLLRITPNLKHLALENCKGLDRASLDYRGFKGLQSLSLNTIPNLEVLKNSANQLKILNIMALDKTISLSSISLKNIERLTLRGQVDASELEALLKDMPKLVSLDLNGLEINGSLSVELSLPQLQDLNLECSEITSKGLSNLLSNSPMLKKLNLCNCRNILKGDITCGSLPMLEDLDLSFSAIPTRSLANLLRNSPKLKNLDLGVCRHIEDEIPCVSLPELEDLHLNSTDITGRSLANLLSNSPKLKNLNLSSCNEIKGDIPCVSLPALEDLRIVNSQVTSLSLANLLSNSPKLKKLDLRGCSGLYDDIPRLSLPELEDLSLNSSTNMSGSLAKRLVNSPKLKRINLDHCQHILHGDIHSAQNELTIDADTSLQKNKALRAKKIFYPLTPGTREPAVSSYRLNVFDELLLSEAPCRINQAFRLINNSNQQQFQETNYRRLQKWSAPPQSSSPMPQYLGTQELTLDTSWQPLASLHPDDTLTDVYTEPSDADITIKYSPKDCRYFIKTTGETPCVRVHFVLSQKEPRPLPTLPEKISSLFNEIKDYGCGELEKAGENWNGKNYLDAIRLQKKGACRHRAVAFKAAMTEYNPNIPVRLITNEVHAFAEVMIDDCWLRMDLGGYPADLLIEEQLQPESESETMTTFSTAHLNEHGQEVSDKPTRFNYEETLST